MLQSITCFIVCTSLSLVQALKLCPTERSSRGRGPLSSLYTLKTLPTNEGAVADAVSFDVDVNGRTRACLDFEIVIDALRESTVTVLGKGICEHRSAWNASECTEQYAMVNQMYSSLDYFPLRTSMDVEPLLRMIELNSSPPDREDLASFSKCIEQVLELLNYFEENGDRLSLLIPLSRRMSLPDELLSVFVDAFDSDEELNAEKFTVIKRLRAEVAVRKQRIVQIINSLLKSPEMQDRLADTGYTELEGRFCLLLKNTFKKGFGIMHGSSNTGRTFYVEPFEVVELTNDLMELRGQLRAEENRILFEMCRCISSHLAAIRESILAVAEVDVVRAKAKLGRLLGGVIPEVLDEGCLLCIDAKHPVLMLRGTHPVGNDIHLSKNTTALVISGPNAGGKTVVLKTAGLFALMARHALPLPAKAGARVDVFRVLADIGDMQTVSGDLSTFSGHLVVCRNILREVASARVRSLHSLVLFDEIGTGTDPVQGAALAQAVLEELVGLGSRIIATTHYQRIKELATENSVFRIAAMEFVDNRPTYRLRLGSVGESFALEAGRRMLLPENVLARAHALMDDESRRIVALQHRLEEETARARQREADLAAEIAGLSEREAAVECAQAKVQEQLIKIREGRTDEFLVELRTKERELAVLIRHAHEIIASQSGSSESKTMLTQDKSIQDTLVAVKALRTATEKDQVKSTAEQFATALIAGEPVDVGTVLVVLERGGLFGSRGMVTQKNKGRGRVCLRIAGAEVKMERHLLGVPHDASKFDRRIFGGDVMATTDKSGHAKAELSNKDRRLLKMLQEDLADPGETEKSAAGRSRR